MKLLYFFSICAVLVSSGCSSDSDAITTDMHEDFDHDHKHQHTGDDDHEHEHKDGFRGAHSHDHSHGHRHGDPLHGGRVVSVGHTHHKDEVAHFHAEVMPVTDNTICFHILTETEDGVSSDHAIDVMEIPAIISVKNQESNSAECVFKGVGAGKAASEFKLQIPERLAEGDSFSVVVPKVKLGGIRQNFSFTVSRTAAEVSDGPASDESPASGGSDGSDSIPAAHPSDPKPKAGVSE